MSDEGIFDAFGNTDNIPSWGSTRLQIPVSGLAGPISAITIRLHMLTTSDTSELAFLLVAPDGTHNLLFLSEGGHGLSLSAARIYVTDYADTEAATIFAVVKPFDRGQFAADDFGIPGLVDLNHAAPHPDGATLASAFNGLDPNGTWNLYALDGVAGGDPSTLIQVILRIVTNVAPVITAPAVLSVESGGSLQFSDANGNIPTAIDPDAGPGDLGTVRVTAEHGTLGNNTPGLFPHFAPTKTAIISADVAGAVHFFFDHTVYTPDPGFTGVDHIKIEFVDEGGQGLPLDSQIGQLTATKTIAIEVFDHPAATSGDDSFTAAGYQKIDGGAGKDTITFGFGLTQATVTYDDNTVTIEGAGTKTVVSGFEKFVFNDGTVDNADASPLIDDLFYYTRNHDVWAANVDADLHYNIFGWHENRDPNAFFSTVRYLDAYDDVQAAGVNPLAHYDVFGWKEDRDPSVRFDTSAYLAAYPDVAAAQVDPLAHFLMFGHQEGRHAFEILTY